MALIFTNKALKKMKDLSIYEGTVQEVYSLGDHRLLGEFQTKQKKYFNIEIGIVYSLDKRTGDPVIISVWKRTNRR